MNESSGERTPSLHVLEIETFGRGGLLHYAYNLSHALAERGHRVTLLTTVGYELEGARRPPGMSVDARLARWSQGPGAGRPSVARLRAEALVDALATGLRARRLRPDVAHLHCANPAALPYLGLLRLVGLRVAATAHVVTPHEPIAFERPVYRLIHRLPHLVIAHSEVDRRRLEEEFRVPARRVEVIPHGEYGFFDRAASPVSRAEARRSLKLEEDDRVALFFGYLREYKGLDVLLDAWGRVRERPGARLVVAGDPVRLGAERRRQLEDRARGLGVVCRFEYVAFDEVSRYFAAADALVMPYRRISQSGVLFLALSLGVPVVATRVGALPEMLRDGEEALLVPPEDPAALALALDRVLSDPSLRRRLAQGGRRVAEAHGWPRIAAATEAAFERLG